MRKTIKMIFVMLALLAGTAEAAVCTSLSAGNWNTAGRWSCGHVPNNTDSVVIAHNITMNVNPDIVNLTINLGATLDDNGNDLTVTGSVLINGTYDGSGSNGNLIMQGNGQTLSGTGTIIDIRRIQIDANTTIPAGSNLNLTLDSQIRVGDQNAATLTIDGTITGTGQTNGNRIIRADNNNTSNVIINGTVNAPNSFIEVQSGGTVTNNGTVSLRSVDGNNNATSTWTQGANSNLTLTQPAVQWVGTFNASANGNTVTYNGTSTVIAPSAAGYWNLAGTIFPAACPVVHTILGSNPCIGAPVVTTNAATALTTTGATLNGAVRSNGAVTTVSFEYGATAAYGNTVAATPGTLAANAASTTVSAVLTGLTCGTTYHYRAKGVNSYGTTNGADLTFTTSACIVCNPPPNIPAGVTVSCQCDNFTRATLNPSPFFGANWIVSTSDATGILPNIVNSGFLRLTNNTGNNAKAATVPGIFPAAGNYISVEFRQYAYNGSGADGVAVTLSDYSVPAVPGAFGGSLGYAQRTGVVGFAGGWLGVALDEYGNYQNPTEGRLGGPGFIVDSVGARGSGSGMNGYRWLGGTATLAPQIDNNGSTTPSLGYYYQVIVDARNEPTSTAIAVNRDTTGTGNSYASLINIPNVYTAAAAQGFTQAPVPTNWQISFTGSTGGSTNIHEIGSLRVCAQYMDPPSGGTADGFNAIDEAYGTPPLAVQNYLNGHIYTKLTGTPFRLNVAALSNNQIVTTYAVGSSKTVTVKLVDNSDSLANAALDCTVSCTGACTSKVAVTGGTQTLTFASGATDKGQKQSPSFTINSAYQKLVAVISDGTTSACSTDSFAVRPASIATVTSSNATNTGTSGLPIFKAGSDNFALSATTTGITGSPSGYTGVVKINNNIVQAASPATVKGTVLGTFPAATSATPASTATGAAFTYSEVGAFTLPGYNPATDTTSRRSVYDGVSTLDECTTPGLTPVQCEALRAATWTGVDSISTKNDCVLDSYSNVRDVTGNLSNNPNYGKFGCNFGLLANTVVFGRFVPDHFDTVVPIVSGVPMPCPTGLTCPAFTWSYADATARLGATGFASADVGKVAMQLDNSTFWVLTAITPTWSQFFSSGFVYSGQPFSVQITARNAGGVVTRNYDSGMTLSKATTLSAWNAVGAPNIAANSNPSGGTLSSNNVPSTAFAAGVGTTTSTPIYLFPTTPVDPADIYVRATDTDNVTSLRAASSIEGGVRVVSGRFRVSNAYGSEMVPLRITATAQYWDGNGWLTSTTDSITSFNTATNLTKAIIRGPLAAGNISAVGAGAVTLAGGARTINLAAPGVVGSADIGLSAPSYLLTGSNGAAVDPSIPGRVTFGVYKNRNNFIYRREN